MMRYHLGARPGPSRRSSCRGELARVTSLAQIRATSVEVDSMSGNLGAVVETA